MKPPLKIAIAGLGTVGTGVAQLLARNGDLIAGRAGRRIELRAVLEKDRKRDRGVDLSKPKWHGGLRELAADPGVDVVVELIGGTEGVALDRANAVAQALVVLGVPANAIAVEAAPTHGGSELPRAEVFMEY